MRPLHYSINVSLDGCVGHDAFQPDEEIHEYFAAEIAKADALLFGRVTYEMMEAAWRRQPDGTWPEWMDDRMVTFAESIDAGKKYVVSSTLPQVDWNAELLQGDLETAVRRLKEEPGGSIHLGGVTLPLALADLGLIDEFVFVVHPVAVGRGPSLFDGLRTPLELELVERRELSGGAVASTYRPAG